MRTDIICGMEVEGEDFIIQHNKNTYYFCSRGCLEKFRRSPDTVLENHVYDLAIIGGGPAGLTAAVYASIFRIDTCLITKQIGGQAIESSKIKNYMGFDFITGHELVEKFRNQFLHEHYLDHEIGEVLELKRSENHFEMALKGDSRRYAHAIIVATGMNRQILGVPGEESFQRRGIFYSSHQDTSLVKGKDVVVIGGGNSGVQTANELRKIGCRVTLVTLDTIMADPAETVELREDTSVRIFEGYITREITGTESVESIVIESEESGEALELPCEGVFIQIGMIPNAFFCRRLLDLNDRGEIMIGHDCSTSIDGVYACGDVTDAFGKRIVIASGEGAKAAIAAREHLLKVK